jgi:hypothetical protein
MLKLGLLTFLACSLAACAATDVDPSSTSDDALSDETFDDADVVQVEAERIVYPARLAKTKRLNALVTQTNENKVPLILVGHRAKDALNADGTLREDVKNANGYLRRVVAVELAANGDVSFLTRKASLTEAAEELARQGVIMRSSDGCFAPTINPFTAFNVDLNKSLYDHSFGSIGHMSVGFVDSYLTVNGNLDTQVAGACLNPTAAHAILNLNLRGQIKLEGRFDGAFGAQTGDIPLFHKRIPITSVAGFPLALDFAVTANCDFASSGKAVANVGATVNGGLSTGATWAEREGFQTQFTPTLPQFGVIRPTFSTNANVNAQCTVSAKALALVFDGDEGPYAEASSYVGMTAEGSGSGAGGNVHAKVVGGVNASLGGTLKPFHITLIDQIQAPSFHKEWTLYEGNFSVHP